MTTTIQQTGKGLKFFLVLSWLMVIAGIVMALAANWIGILVSIVGFVSLGATKALIWWNHA